MQIMDNWLSSVSYLEIILIGTFAVILLLITLKTKGELKLKVGALEINKENPDVYVSYGMSIGRTEKLKLKDVQRRIINKVSNLVQKEAMNQGDLTVCFAFFSAWVIKFNDHSYKWLWEGDIENKKNEIILMTSDIVRSISEHDFSEKNENIANQLFKKSFLKASRIMASGCMELISFYQDTRDITKDKDIIKLIDQKITKRRDDMEIYSQIISKKRGVYE